MQRYVKKQIPGLKEPYEIRRDIDIEAFRKEAFHWV